MVTENVSSFNFDFYIVKHQEMDIKNPIAKAKKRISDNHLNNHVPVNTTIYKQKLSVSHSILKWPCLGPSLWQFHLVGHRLGQTIYKPVEAHQWWCSQCELSQNRQGLQLNSSFLPSYFKCNVAAKNSPWSMFHCCLYQPAKFHDKGQLMITQL